MRRGTIPSFLEVLSQKQHFPNKYVSKYSSVGHQTLGTLYYFVFELIVISTLPDRFTLVLGYFVPKNIPVYTDWRFETSN